LAVKLVRRSSQAIATGSVSEFGYVPGHLLPDNQNNSAICIIEQFNKHSNDDFSK
jgi:hypothetical protein